MDDLQKYIRNYELIKPPKYKICKQLTPISKLHEPSFMANDWDDKSRNNTESIQIDENK